MFRALLAVFAALYFAIPADAGILVQRHAHGCQGGQASAGCQGKQGGCASAQAGCVGHSGGCHGGFGGRFHPLQRLHDRRHHASNSVPSAPVAVPANPPKPMPKSAAACAEGECPVIQVGMVYGVESTATDALAEVNAARAKRGLRPFQRDEGLMVGALKCAEYRAARRMAGHTQNDFQFLPAGTTATVGGCSALEPSWGFQSCAMYEHWTTAGAASVKGNDGRIYHQLFAR